MGIQKTQFDIISIGDATLDTFIELEDALIIKNKQHGESLCLPFADKIPINKLVNKVAGNAANVAVGTARLGLTSAFWTVLGDDEFASNVIKKMKDEGVSTKYVEKEKGKESNFTVVLNYNGERTQLIHRLPRKYDLPNDLAKARYVYLTAMGENHQLVYPELLKYLATHGVKLAYNPGKFQINCEEQICTDVLPFTEILFVNREEAELILKRQGFTKFQKKATKKYFKTLITELHKLGAEIVVITDGPRGAYSGADMQFYYMPIYEGPVVERTGAGDSFGTGFTSAILQGKSSQEALVWGTLNAWSVVQQVGPQDGLLTKRQMQQLLKKNGKLKPEKI
jgi:fructoselysine 6-kinase